MLYLSGYTDDAVVRAWGTGSRGRLPAKTLHRSRTSLARKVREVLDSPKGFSFLTAAAGGRTRIEARRGVQEFCVGPNETIKPRDR